MRRSVLLLPLALLYLALSGFDCAGSSAQMTTAKVALQRKDYAAAAEALQKEVELRPNNGVAWLALADANEKLGRTVASSEAIRKARAATAPKLDAQQLDDASLLEYNLWLNTYNRAVLAHRDKDYRRALAILDTAQMVGPTMSENLYFRAVVNEDLDDKTGAARAHQEYATLVTPAVEMGTKLGLSLQMTPQAVEAKFGAPTKMSLDTVRGGYYYYAPQNLYVYFAAPFKERGYAVEGWRTVDATIPEALRPQPVILRADPYAFLGLEAQQAKRYDEALRYLQTLSRLDPNRAGVAATITQIYLDAGRMDQAIASLREEIAANPRDPRAHLDLGNLYFGAKPPRYADAAASFEKVLTLGLPADDANVKTALFNLGAVYKNNGAILQDSIRKVSNNKPTKAQTEVYLAPLREAAKYFERYRSADPSDFRVLVELGNLYDVVGDVPARDRTITALEGLESANARNEAYWRSMSKLYAQLGDAKKAEAADKKAEALR